MKRKEKYNLNKLDAIIDYKINGCGKIIPSVRLVTMKYEGKQITKRIETNESALRFILDWLEEEDDSKE